ncbi:beta/alpha barrel domain-containing protein [Mycobacterium montefiorense]|uniref:Hydroxymethylglutaryl-CoA lyase n=1 Tax=Mycobacterium montefiorense TaxID=154654 RepID=A0AA37UVY4_9MYCO|nr:hydroxymethylglutaryl-CoA lyase [Mycobacterium montefiorense]GBG40370.1 hydroxymethylglutaryl-CoA lyase [Mycobacterium montefiorense]GKU36267.1 hydroxymethylglutaryl-CoA lyase [Mycobacterium montefiorense]GKU42846.1 hydroxymethylglutaryl-CoA lyase [Mycobacterium montefiorense]GKU46467.1 hydroxymethylglutaryl-CoA lyase [Mycobacterium montefiorense]GKU53652.1 hydroxymethylglutaryl-CoA lyase [Mycobacterium montefiorense]
MTTSARLRDVTLRDGLQLTGKLLDTDTKVGLARALLDAGIDALEIGAMARPDLVPPMANTVEVIEALTPEELQRCWVWTATPRGVTRAIEAGARNLEYCLSVSDQHNYANVGRTTEQSMAALPEAVDFAAVGGARLQLTLATAFTCPYQGTIDPKQVIDLVSDNRAAGISSVMLCDTLGQATPDEVRQLVTQVRDLAPELEIVFHGHDTWGLGVANTIAAIQAGADMVDGALGGLGGCPFAPGASGNTSTEDLLFALQPPWLTPSVFSGVVTAGAQILAQLDEPNRSRAAEGARSTADAFPWVT